jgi:hypothetical protein
MKIATLFTSLLLVGCVVINPTIISTELTPEESVRQSDIQAYYDLVNVKVYDGEVNATIQWGVSKDPKKWIGLCTFSSTGRHKIEIDSVYFSHSTTKHSMYLKGTIIHEVVHARLGVPGHGPGFQTECDRVGKLMGIAPEYIYNKGLYVKDTTP